MSGVWGATEVGTQAAAGPQTDDPVAEAVDLLFRARHHLTPDVLRSLADVWQCGSAARYGEPHERFWELDTSFYDEHEVAECEAENQFDTAGDLASDEEAGA